MFEQSKNGGVQMKEHKDGRLEPNRFGFNI